MDDTPTLALLPVSAARELEEIKDRLRGLTRQLTGLHAEVLLVEQKVDALAKLAIDTMPLRPLDQAEL